MMDDLAVLLLPLAAGVLALSTHAPLGEQVLRRGVVFMDLAIAQIAALGTLVATSLVESEPVAGAAGAAAALAGAGLVAWLGGRFPSLREALIGLVYITAAVVALLWMSVDAQGERHLAAMLSGDVLWVTWRSLVPLALVSACFFLLQPVKACSLAQGRAFYPWFALAVSASVPVLGLYLVFATLIVPAVLRAARPGAGWIGVVATGSAAYAVGLLSSLAWDLPSGPCVVVALVAVGVGGILRG